MNSFINQTEHVKEAFESKFNNETWATPIAQSVHNHVTVNTASNTSANASTNATANATANSTANGTGNATSPPDPSTTNEGDTSNTVAPPSSMAHKKQTA